MTPAERSIIGFLVGVIVTILVMACAAVVFEPELHKEKTEKGYYSYPDQTKDKADCELNVVRSNNCVLTYKWSPKED